MPIAPLPQEREDLNLHVDICAQRYAELEKHLDENYRTFDARLTKIEEKIEGFEAVLTENKRSLSAVILSSSATILTGLIGVIATLLIKF